MLSLVGTANGREKNSAHSDAGGLLSRTSTSSRPEYRAFTPFTSGLLRVIGIQFMRYPPVIRSRS